MRARPFVRLSAPLVLGMVAALPAAAEEALDAAGLLKHGDEVFRSRDDEQATAICKRAVLAAEKAGATETLAMAARGHLIRKQATEGQPFLDRGPLRREAGAGARRVGRPRLHGTWPRDTEGGPPGRRAP